MTTRAELNAARQPDDPTAERHWGRGDAPEARYINGRRVRAAGQIDEYGMYYPIPTSRGKGLLSFLCWMFAIGAFCLMLYAILPGLLSRPVPLGVVQPLPTAAMMPPPPPAALPAAPDYGIGAYNQEQQATAAALQASQEAPGATEAPAVEQAPVIAPETTPLPAPGQPGFQESFKPAGCPMGVTILNHNDPCYTVPPGAKLPEPGEDGFADSFK